MIPFVVLLIDDEIASSPPSSPPPPFLSSQTRRPSLLRKRSKSEDISGSKELASKLKEVIQKVLQRPLYVIFVISVTFLYFHP